MNIEVANRLAELRKRNGLSQEQLAERLGISRQAVSKWERAESSPDTDNLIALARLYGVSLDVLLKMSPEAESDELFARESEETDFGPDEADEAPKGRFPQSAVHPEGGRFAPVFGREAKWGGPERLRDINWYHFPYPVLVTFVYLLLGFALDLWHPGWMLFLTVPIYYTAVCKDGFDLNRVPYPLLVAVIYLIGGIAWDLWHPGWLIFLTIPLYYTLPAKLLGTGLNLVLIAAAVIAVFWMLGAMIGVWTQITFAVVGVALAAAGIIQTLRK